MKNNEIGGVWRTIAGRRVFIKEGQDLASAMIESGKFSKLNKYNELQKKLYKDNKKLLDMQRKCEEEQKELNKKENEYLKERSNWIKENYPNIEKGTEEYKIIREKYDEQHKKDYSIENTKIYKETENHRTEIRTYYTKELKGKSLEESKRKTLLQYVKKDTNGYDEIGEKLLQSTSEEQYNMYVKFGKLAKENNYEISKSPYSSSMYAIPKGDVVDWDYKPMDSYRIADHWNFESRGKIHCKLKDSEEYTIEFLIGKWNGKEYERI